MDDPEQPSRFKRRFVTMLVLVALVCAGWSAVWYYAAHRAEGLIAGWKAREAQAGRLYECSRESIAGYPFRIEVLCDGLNAQFRGSLANADIKTTSVLVAAQIYDPELLISEVTGPLTFSEPGRAPVVSLTWSLGQSSVRGLPSAPERASLVFENPTVNRINGGETQALMTARRFELHGRIAEGSVSSAPVIETVLRLQNATAPVWHDAAAKPVDADITAMLRGLNDFAPKPWAQRFREIQAAGGRIDITQARVEQGQTLATGSGSLSINASGRLDGQLRVTVAGLEDFLERIGAQQMVQNSPAVDRLAGALDRFSPGLGAAARQQVGQNLSAGINMLGEQTTLDGRRAVTLPLRFSDGAVFLGPVPLGHAPPLF